MRLPFTLIALAAAAHAGEFKIGIHTFNVADGYEIQAVAAPPLVERPINMSFGEDGALYVTDSSGSNEKPAEQLKKPTHRILRLVDRDGDGTFDDKTVFADRLAFPEGAMWLDGSLYVSAPPQIWKFTDTDADGLADKREVWFDGKTLTGCANDLHGPYAGPDGFIYWCKGAWAEQRHRLADGGEFVTRASHIFRARPDGGGLEAVMSGGMDNPVDVVFTPGGERLMCGTFFVHPGNGQRDGILHAVWGGVWGKEHDPIKNVPRTGPLMPIMAHLGPAAASGLELPRSAQWGGDAFCTLFNMRKVTRHSLTPDGATFKTTDSDFVVSDQADFHPTDIIEDADGSLLIADTGGWYRICCPTSTLAKPDVLGAIYRVRKKDAPRGEDPRGLRLDWKADAATLAGRLADPRHEVAARAMSALAKLGEPAIAPISTHLSTPRVGANTTPTFARLNAIHTLTRIPGEAARAAVRFAFADKDPLVRIAVAHSASLWRDAGAAEALINMLASTDASQRRIAAEALGRIGDKRATPHLIYAKVENDRYLDHSLTFALYELADIPPLETANTDRARTALAMIAKRAAARPAMPPVPEVPLISAPAPDPAIVKQQRDRLGQLAAATKNGDAQRGGDIFRSAKAACATCHAIAGFGGTLGPDLTRIGAIRTELDLLEAIVFPSTSFVRSYEAIIVKAKGGEHLGIVTTDSPDEIVLASGVGTEARIKRGDVISKHASPVSLMPPGFDGILTPQELADLVAFLRRQN
jgi:putative membrane-bound dehydrogenase-like protein